MSAKHAYEVLADLYWDGTQLRKKGDIFETDEPLKIAAKSAHYTPSLKPVAKGKAPDAAAAPGTI